MCALRSDTDLVNGMYLTAQIIIGTKNSQCLPIEAIVKSNGETYILVEKISHADSFSFQLRKVNLGIEQDGFVEIMNAQDLQDKNILLKGSYFLYQ